MSAYFSASSHRPSLFLRTACLVYLVLIVYASLFPFSGWENPQVSPFHFLMEPLPKYWTWFDILTNIIAYLFLGFLLVTSMTPFLRGMSALILSVFLGGALSFCMEAIQNYLSVRISSNLDLMMNILGTFLGGVIGLFMTPILFREDRFHFFMQRWVRFQSSRVLVIPLLWPLAQIYPQNYLFGNGELRNLLAMGIESLRVPLFEFSAQQYWLAETLITATGLSSAMLIYFYLLKPDAPKLFIGTLMLIITMAIKTIACALYFENQAFVWLTPGAIGGIIFGILMVMGLAFSASDVQWKMALFMSLISFIAINVLPENQYFLSTLQTWSQGKFLNFNGVAHFVTLSWPFLAFLFLIFTRPK